MEQARKRRSSEENSHKTDSPSTETKKDPKIEEDKQAADDLLDAIDAILEENAQAFVQSYIQHGGE